ncbi:Bestrophin, RFP-TM, chloride channel-domain-containing protein [Russula compacta]|nr:Bestrophin, RFP-TM, chloride channel-domain-containing protein [Russula compacta]
MMAEPSRRTASGDHNLLPATESRRVAIIDSFSSIFTLFAWTFGSGAVFWRIWPAVLLHTLFATAVVVISLHTPVNPAVPNLMLTVLGVVIGFVISYHASSGGDRYWLGRTAWSDVVKHIQTSTRLIWFHVPLRLTPKTPQELAQLVAPSRSKEEAETIMKEKRAALDLLEGFAVSLKHHLRGELGIYYEDLYDLVKPLHEHHHHSHPYGVVSNSSATATVSPLWHAPGYSENDPLIPPITAYGSISLSRSASNASQPSPLPLLPACGERPLSLLDRVSADLIPFAAYLSGIFSRSREESNKPGTGIGRHGGIQRRWATGNPAFGRKVCRPMARGDENLPVEILRLLGDWFAILEERGTVPGTSLGAMIGTVAALDDSLSVAERILTTPLPFIYAVHLRTVWIYLFFLPLQLVAQFSWYTIPGVAMAAFIYLGFLAVGDDIGQPFGYDENDLDLDLICREIIHADLSRLKQMPGVNVFLGSHENIPHDVPAQADADLLGM